MLILSICIILTVAMSDNRMDNDVLRVRDGSFLSIKRMMTESRKASIIVVGEVHDIPEHHQLELEIIRSLHESDASFVVGIEMFRADSQKILDAWSSGKLSRERFVRAYYDNWTVPWPLYRGIFEYVLEHRIPLLGLNIPDDIAETVAKKGFASLSTEQKKRLPPGISCDVDPVYRDFIRKAFSEHVKPDDKRFLNFCEAQMVWDKTMAWRLIEYLDKHPGVTAVVLAGVGHSWRRGIPEQISRQSKYTSLVILPLIPGQIDGDTVTSADADFVARGK